MSVVLTKTEQTCWACPSQWDGWDAEGNYYYLRYRWGVGTVDAYPNADSDTWRSAPDGRIAHFKWGDDLDGVISLEDFVALAGLELAA